MSTQSVPTLESLALDVVAANVTDYDAIACFHMAAAPASSSGSPDRAASAAQTLGPLLRSWSFVEEHEESLGAPLAYAAATCPAIASVAAGFLVHQSVEQKIVALPDGTRKAIAVGSSDDR